MSIDYIKEFPVPLDSVPPRLRALLEPASRSPSEMIPVTTRWDSGGEEPKEIVVMLMAAVHEDEIGSLLRKRGTGEGVVSYSTPFFDKKGSWSNFSPSIDGRDYIVASWGDGSSFSFSLAEKVWMTLGLTPRCIGNEEQKLVYDDLRAPDFEIADGEISSEYYFSASRNVNWRMRNEYLRKYLWARGAAGVRYFFYEAHLQDSVELRVLMDGQKYYRRERPEDWFILDIREWRGGLLLQAWGTVVAVDCGLCPRESADTLVWPDIPGPMTRQRANLQISGQPVYLNDGFLEKYEQNTLYNSTPAFARGHWLCAPSYRGKWTFDNFQRVGRNLIKTTIRDIYKGVPDVEVVHAHSFALSLKQVRGYDLSEEHIVSKVGRLVDQIVNLGEGLSNLGAIVGVEATPEEWIRLSREKLARSGWAA